MVDVLSCDIVSLKLVDDLARASMPSLMLLSTAENAVKNSMDFIMVRKEVPVLLELLPSLFIPATALMV